MQFKKSWFRLFVYIHVRGPKYGIVFGSYHFLAHGGAGGNGGGGIE